MAIYKKNMVDIELENGSIHRSFLNRPIGKGDNQADRFGVRVFRNKVPVELTGVSVSGFFRDPNGTNIAITSGVTEGNEAYVVLPQACYNYDGNFTLAIKLTGDGITGTMRIVDGVVANTNIDSPVVPTSEIPTIEEVIALYEQVVDALEEQIIVYPYTFHADNYIDKTTGNMVPFTSTPNLYSASTWIPIRSKKLSLFASNGGDAGGIAFYDKDFHFISGDSGRSSWQGNLLYEFEAPDKARYMRFTQFTSYRTTTYLKGITTAGQLLSDASEPYGEIVWGRDMAYAINGDGSLASAPGSSYSDMLLLRETEKYLNNWDRDTTYFYMNLFNSDNAFVGTKRHNGAYYDPEGNAVSSIDYHSYSLSIAQPYSYYTERTVYLDKPYVEQTTINCASIPALENALIEAFIHANPCHEYHIYMAEGTYDVWDGLDKTRLGTGSASGDLVGKRGLELPGNTHLYGKGKCVLDLELPEDQRADYSMCVSTLNTNGCNASVHNMTFIAYDCRYTIHDDAREIESGEVLWDRCHFKFKGNRDTTYHDVSYCYGAGFFGKRKGIFRNCTFEGGNGAGTWAGIFVHNHQTSKEPMSLLVENCAFLESGSAIIMNMFYAYNENFTVTVNNTHFESGSSIDLKGAAGGYLYGGGNDSVTVNDTATTPTENYMVT